jgi:UDP-N-acetylmuramoyl-tripeptide--D-alanyl-D-alanine ligase
MRSALESFAANNTELNKLAILGEMKELGPESRTEHEKIVKLMEELAISGYFVGEEFEGITSKVVIGHFSSTDTLIDSIGIDSISEKLILLKGSRSVKLEKLENHL